MQSATGWTLSCADRSDGELQGSVGLQLKEVFKLVRSCLNPFWQDREGDTKSDSVQARVLSSG